MTSLEFIKKEIESRKESIRFWETQLEKYPNDEVFTSCLNKRKKELQALFQIKGKLEAWEVVKIETLITDGGVIHMAIEGDDVGYETVIKALEAKDE